MRRRGRSGAAVGVDEDGHFTWIGERWSGRHWVGGQMGVRDRAEHHVITDACRFLPSSIDVAGTVRFESIHPEAVMPWPIGRRAEGKGWLWRRDSFSLSVIASVPESALLGLCGQSLGKAIELGGRLAETPLTQSLIKSAEQRNDVLVFFLQPADFL